tara:strand:- start:1594 stop:2637 length:1044 start_codon:yes stop_codon:yes gene_type:complete
MKRIKAKKMKTGGLMSMPPFIKKQKDEEDGITPYDVSTPQSARQGMPSRLLSPSRTRFNKGGESFPDLDGSGNVTQKDILIGRGVIKKAMGGLLKRKQYGNGDEVLDEDTFEEYPIKDLEKELVGEQANAKDNIEKMKFEKLEGLKESGIDLTAKQEKELEEYKAKTRRVKVALGGMIGVEKGKYDQRPDYQAYAEGDIVEEETMEEEVPMEMDMEDSLLEKPVGMDEEMEEDITDEDMEGMDAIIDTSALSEEEETLLDEAVDMHPELEAIIPKLVATEFTEDGEVEGPGTGTSDSIPALLSDGEFVFTAKAVKNLGVDKLRKMMKQAEESYDAGVQSQEEEQEIV